jgi:folate-binding protein YgfZ
MGKAYQEARQRSVSIDRSARGRLVVLGKDRASYLHGLLTNDIASLHAGTGCYSAYLTPQGRMISDLWVYELGDVILINLPSEATKNTVLQKLDQFIFSEDVQLGDVTNDFAQVAIVGPEAAAVVATLLGESAERLASLPEHGCLRGSIAGGAAIVTRVSDTGEPGLDLYVEKLRFETLRGGLSSLGVPEADADTVDVLRIEAGIPRFHVDMNEDTIPLEAGIEARAISMNKGCYVGQEVIIRVLHRGHGRVAKKLVGLTVDAASTPSAGTIVKKGEQEIGKVTSAVRSVALDRPIALAYLQRDFLEPGTTVSVDGANAVVTALPFAAATDSSRPDRSQ